MVSMYCIAILLFLFLYMLYKGFSTERSRRQGNDEYYCIRSGGSDSPLIHYGYYTMLRRTMANGEDEILYEMEVPNDQKFIESGGINERRLL